MHRFFSGQHAFEQLSPAISVLPAKGRQEGGSSVVLRGGRKNIFGKATVKSYLDTQNQGVAAWKLRDYYSALPTARLQSEHRLLVLAWYYGASADKLELAQ